MGPLRFIGIIILLASLLTSCSQKISKLEFDKQAYEYEQLKFRYELLKQETAGNTTKSKMPSNTRRVTNDVNLKKYNDLQQKHEVLLEEQEALKTTYEELRERHYKPTEATPNENVPAVENWEREKEIAENRYAALEKRYDNLKKVISDRKKPATHNAEIIEIAEIDPTKNIGKGAFEVKENSIDFSSSIIQSASFNGLFFDYDTYERTEDYLILEVAIKNNSRTNLKTVWDARRIQIVTADNNIYTSNTFRVGVDYAAEKSNRLTKKIKDEYTVFARFAFEDIPKDIKKVKNLKFIVEIDGKECVIEFTHIDVSEISD